MARAVKDPSLESRSARRKATLAARAEPYWRVIGPGLALGYRKGSLGGSWVARWRDPSSGKQHYQALGTADDALDADGERVLTFWQAQERTRGWAEQRQKQDDGEQDHGSYTVERAMQDYLAWVRLHRKSERETRYAIERHILPTLGGIEVSRLTASRIEKWHEGLASTPARLRTRPGAEQRYREMPDEPDVRRARQATANRLLTVLKAGLNRAFARGKVASDNPWRRVKPFRGADAARVRWLREEECRRLLNASREDFRNLVRAALVTGCRYGELCLAEVEDFSPDAGALQVRESKGGKSRWVPLDREACAFLEELTAGRPAQEPLFRRADGGVWGKSQQKRPMQDACERAGIEPPVGIHVLRHTWASHRVMAGMPLLMVSQVLGHTDTRMVEKHYGHLAPSFVRQEIDRTAMDLGPVERKVVTIG